MYALLCMACFDRACAQAHSESSVACSANPKWRVATFGVTRSNVGFDLMHLHSVFLWRANNMGDSAAVAYLLLIVTVVVCSSFFNYVVLSQMRKAHS